MQVCLLSWCWSPWATKSIRCHRVDKSKRERPARCKVGPLYYKGLVPQKEFFFGGGEGVVLNLGDQPQVLSVYHYSIAMSLGRQSNSWDTNRLQSNPTLLSFTRKQFHHVMPSSSQGRPAATRVYRFLSPCVHMGWAWLPLWKAKMCVGHSDSEKLLSNFSAIFYTSIYKGPRPACPIPAAPIQVYFHIADKAEPTFHIYLNSVVSKETVVQRQTLNSQFCISPGLILTLYTWLRRPK